MSIIDTEAYERLIGAAFNYISFRLRSVSEIRGFLKKKIKKYGITPSVEDEVMKRLVELGYADDAKFCEWWITSRQSRSPKGVRVIRQELLKKGINKQLLESVLEKFSEQTGSISQHDLALKAVQKKVSLWRKLSVLERKKKLYGFLGRRGFSAEVIASVIDDVAGKDYNTSIE